MNNCASIYNNYSYFYFMNQSGAKARMEQVRKKAKEYGIYLTLVRKIKIIYVIIKVNMKSLRINICRRICVIDCDVLS